MNLSIHTTRVYSKHIRLFFGLVCDQLVIMKERIARTEKVSLSDGKIADVENSYKC